jgi:hypothetical protein
VSVFVGRYKNGRHRSWLCKDKPGRQKIAESVLGEERWTPKLNAEGVCPARSAKSRVKKSA